MSNGKLYFLVGVDDDWRAVKLVLLVVRPMSFLLVERPMFLDAWPNSIFLQRWANTSEHSVSGRLYSTGLMFTNIITLEFPPNESWSKNVSFELRYGTWFPFCPFLPKAEMTSPKALKERLMFCASFSRSPDASVLPTRSEPAKSMRLSFAAGGRTAVKVSAFHRDG